MNTIVVKPAKVATIAASGIYGRGTLAWVAEISVESPNQSAFCRQPTNRTETGDFKEI